MKIVNNNPLDLLAPQGELLTLRSNAGPAVTIAFDTPGGQGQLLPGQTHSFTVPAPGLKPFCLVAVTCTFKTSATCDVRLTDPAGNSAPFTFSSAFGLHADSIVYTIDIEPPVVGGGR